PRTSTSSARLPTRRRGRAQAPGRDRGLDCLIRLDYEAVRDVRTPIVIGTAFVAQYPTGGGVFWIPLQYLRGLRELGYDAWWVELLWTRGDAGIDRANIDAFWRHARELDDVAERVALLHFPDSTRDGPQGRIEYHGLGESAYAALRRDALLLNLANSVTAPHR